MDAHFGCSFNSKNLEARSVFIGGVPRDTTAEMLAMKLETHFGVVDEVIIDLNQDTMYPRGTTRVAFKYPASASKAIWTQTLVLNRQHRVVSLCMFIFTVNATLFQIELKPFLIPHQQCVLCDGYESSVFCPTCMHVMCDSCWELCHMMTPDGHTHKKITRGTFYTPRRIR